MAFVKEMVLIVAIIAMGSVYLTGCSQEDGLDLDAGTGMTDSSNVVGEEENNQEGDTGEAETGEAEKDMAGQGEEGTNPTSEDEELARFSGILKAADSAAGTATVINENDGELVLQVDDKTRILEGETQINLIDLANKIGSEVIVEYDEQTKLITIICAQDGIEQ